MTVDLSKYGLAKKYPRVRELAKEAADLEKRASEAWAAARAAQNALQSARVADTEAAAVAVRSGKSLPEPENEHRERATLDAAQRDALVFERAAAAARQDLAEYVQQHRAEILDSLQAALHKRARELSDAAASALNAYVLLEDATYDVKALAPPPPSPETGAPGGWTGDKLSVSFIGFGPDLAQYEPGPARGDVENVLRYLAGAPARYPQPGEASGAEGAA